MEEHIVEINDTLLSISEKYSISLNQLLQLNSLNEGSLLLPGMKIILKSTRKKSTQIIECSDPLIKNVAYCTIEGDIEGNLIITPQSVAFQPIKKAPSTKADYIQNITKYEVYIDHGNIYEINILDNCDIKPREHEIFIQIIVKSTGDEIKYQSEENLPKAFIYFKVRLNIDIKQSSRFKSKSWAYASCC